MSVIILPGRDVLDIQAPGVRSGDPQATCGRSVVDNGSGQA
jgi:hypothetical protein